MDEAFTLEPLPERDDGRGAVFRMDLQTLAWVAPVADIHVVAIAPGTVRGNHRHHARREVVWVRYDGVLEVV